MLYSKKINFKKNKLQRKGKMRYASKSYTNPFFPKEKIRKTINKYDYSLSWQVKVISGAIFVFLIALLWFLFYSNFFDIKNINIEGGDRIKPAFVTKLAEEQINNNRYVVFNQKNIFLFSKKNLQATLEEKYSFDELKITKKLPRTLNIIFIEKQYAFVWEENDVFYYSDINRKVINEANPLEVTKKEYPIIKNISDQKIDKQSISVEQKYIDFVFVLFNKFVEFEDIYKVDRYLIDNDRDSVKVLLEEGPSIYFSTDLGLEKQFEKLRIIHSEQIKDDFYSKEYINLRIGDSVYYR